jgi:hypothetical protein
MNIFKALHEAINKPIKYNTMSQEKIYVKGMMILKKNDNAPDFVLGRVVITPKMLMEFLKEYDQYSSEYNGNKQWSLNLLRGKESPYLTLDTYKKQEKPVTKEVNEDELWS